MAKTKFIKLYNLFIGQSNRLSKSELLTFLWFAAHADAKGNIVFMNAELNKRLLEFVKIKQSSMYNVINKLERKKYIVKEGSIVFVSADFANKHRQNNVYQDLTPYNWSLAELDF